MTGVSEEPTYEFDVAVSFAGEDRELVEGIVSRLKDAGVRLFYDTDYRSAMWGEDLVEYLDQIYRLKARYAIMFISRSYAEKMWTSHERRSALARALEQRSAYVLPVRLDSTPLDGLRPTVGYLDVRLVGPDGIVSAMLAKLAGTPPLLGTAAAVIRRSQFLVPIRQDETLPEGSEAQEGINRPKTKLTTTADDALPADAFERSGQGSRLVEIDMPRGEYKLAWASGGEGNYFRVAKERPSQEILVSAVLKVPGPATGELLVRIDNSGRQIFSVDGSKLEWKLTFTTL